MATARTALKAEFSCVACGCSECRPETFAGGRVAYCKSCGLGRRMEQGAVGGAHADDSHLAAGSTSDRDKRWAAALLAALRVDEPVLDVGRGGGPLLSVVAAGGSKGIEGDDALAVGLRDRSVAVISKSLFDEDVGRSQAGQFGAITAIRSLECERDLRGAIVRAFELLKPDGVLLFEMALAARKYRDVSRYPAAQAFFPTVRSIEMLFSNHAVAGVVLQSAGGASYIGIATRNSAAMHRYFEIFNRISAPGKFPDARSEQRARALMHVIYGNCADNADLQFLDALEECDADMQELRRLVKIVARAAATMGLDAERAAQAQAELKEKLDYIGRLTAARDWHEAQADKWKRMYDQSNQRHQGQMNVAFGIQKAERSQLLERVKDSERGIVGRIRRIPSRLTAWSKNPLLTLKLATVDVIMRLGKNDPERAARVVHELRRAWWKITRQARMAETLVSPALAPVAALRNKGPVEYRIEAHATGAPLVSVVIPCFNYGRFVREAVESVQKQTIKDLEIIVVEGGSNDGETPAIVASLADEGVRVLARTERHRAGSNRNFGIEQARGKYICCLDADDKIDPTYIEKAVYLMETRGYDVVSTSVEQFENVSDGYNVADVVDLDVLLKGNQVATCGLFKRDLWRMAGGYKDHGDGSSKTHIHEDWEFWIRLAALGARFYNIRRERLFKYRVHGTGSLSQRPEVRSMDEQIKFIIKENSDVLNSGAIENSVTRRLTPHNPVNPLINLLRSPLQTSSRQLLIALPWMVLGGAERLLSSLVAGLVTQGWEVTIITTLPPDPSGGDTSGWFAEHTPHIFDLPKYMPEDQWAGFVDYLIESRGVEALLMAGSTFVYEQLPRLKRKYPELRIYDLLFNTVGHTPNNRRYSGYINKTLCENSEVRDWLRQKGEEEGRIGMIPSAVKIVDLPSAEERAMLRRALDIEPGKLIVGFCGRWSPEKNPIGFVDIAGQLASNANIHFVMTGAGIQADAISSRLRDMAELENRFHLLGNVPELGPILAGVDLLILPSKLDGRPVVVMEAMAIGVPVIASRVGGLPELIIPGKNGDLCAPGDTAAFVKVINAIEHDREFLRRLSTGARAFAEQNLDIAIMVAAYSQQLQN